MNIRVSLISDAQSSKAVQPCEGALDDPAVSPQTLTRLDAASRNAGQDAALTSSGSAAREVVALVGMDLGRAMPWVSTAWPEQWRYGVEQVFEASAVMLVGRSDQRRQRRAPAINDQMVLGPRLAAVGRIWPRFEPPFGAGMDEPSSAARSQSILPAVLNRFSSRRWIFDQTPAACQSRSRRQQVIPHPQPNSWGRYSHGMPVLSTKMIPRRQSRSDRRGRPPLGLRGGAGGISGATISQRASGSNSSGITANTALDRAFQHGKVRCS